MAFLGDAMHTTEKRFRYGIMILLLLITYYLQKHAQYETAGLSRDWEIYSLYK